MKFEYKKKFNVLLQLGAFLLFGCSTSNGPVTNSENLKIQAVHQEYVNGWREMDREKILSLFREDARIQPNSLPPKHGKEEISSFWFPEDGSVTIINQFDSDILAVNIFDTLATVSYTSYLDWSYKKDSTQLNITQNGFGTMILRKENQGMWKIWRQMWTDVRAANK